jgi:hypothetical protein
VEGSSEPETAPPHAQARSETTKANEIVFIVSYDLSKVRAASIRVDFRGIRRM